MNYRAAGRNAAGHFSRQEIVRRLALILGLVAFGPCAAGPPPASPA
jgi:hypothetical protein